MPDRDDDHMYRIKSPLEEYERLVKEDLLVKSTGYSPEEAPARVSRHSSSRIGGPHSITSSARASSVAGTSRPIALAALRLMTSSTFAQSLPERSKSPRTPKPQHPLSAMSYCHMSFDWCSEAIANAVGGKCISYVGGNLCLCLLIQASNCCCDRGC